MGKRAQFLGMEREDKGHHMLMIWSYLVGNGQVPGAHSPSPVHYLAIVPNPSPNLQGKKISGLPPSLVLIIIFYYLRVNTYSTTEVRRNQYYQATLFSSPFIFSFLVGFMFQRPSFPFQHIHTYSASAVFHISPRTEQNFSQFPFIPKIPLTVS